MRPIAITQYAGDEYYRALEKAGAREIVTIRQNTLLKEFDACGGLVIPGGRDVDPSWYGEEPGPYTQMGDLQRDSLEIALIRRALAKDMPVLGVCRGHQLLNVAMGGSLIQHLKKEHPLKHRAFLDYSVHLNGIDEDVLWVNSLHHQAIKEVAQGLRVTARSHDGTIEAVEGTENTFVVGVQWHPERTCNYRFDREMRELLGRFIRARK